MPESCPSPAAESDAASTQRLARSLATSVASIGTVTGVERAVSFLANVAAARVAGPNVFGSYSAVINASLVITSYAGNSLGSAALRFSGKYGKDAPEYIDFTKQLSLISLSATLAMVVAVFLGSGFIATRLLGHPQLADLFRIGAFLIGGLVLLECCRGVLTGQRDYKALLIMTLASGLGMISLLPLAARSGAHAMLATQAFVISVVVAGAAMYLWPSRSGIFSMHARNPAPMHRGDFLNFGLVQLASTLAISSAGAVLVALVVRSDSSMREAGFFGVANQMRNVVFILPSLLGYGGYPLLVKEAASANGEPSRVVDLCTTGSALVALVIGGTAILAIPALLRWVYGGKYDHAEQAIALAVATAMIHSVSSPAASRLALTSLPHTATINGLWSLLIVTLGVWLTPSGGAAAATMVMLIAHLSSAVFILVALRRFGCASDTTLMASGVTFTCALFLGAMGYLRAGNTSSGAVMILWTIMPVVLIGSIALTGVAPYRRWRYGL